jgi:beta-N-acetylhexosaminidase
LALLVLAGLVALVAGLLAGGAAEDGGRGGESAEPGPRSRQRAPQIGSLTLRQQVGQLLVSSFDGTRVPAYLSRRLRARESAGVILFARNVESERALAQLTRALQASAGGGALVAADQEGGAIRSVPFTGPQAGQAGQGAPADVERSARAAGVELRQSGVNVNLAPVADIASAPTSVVAGRAFAGGPEEVAARVGGFVRGLRAARVGATAKHFPGLGAAGVNTDDAPVTIGASRRELESRELVPFRAALRGRVPLVMAGHALYPALDRARIASQSRAVLERLLRARLRFRGVIVTDSLEADAVLSRSGVGLAAERSVAAGADLLLLTGSGSWNLVFPRLLERARRSPAFRARVRESAARVLALKRSLGLRGGP